MAKTTAPSKGSRTRKVTWGNEKKSKATTRNRRTPGQLLQYWEDRLNDLTERYEGQRKKIQDKIDDIKNRRSRQIAIEELLATKTPEELAQMLEELRNQQSIIKKAHKQAGSGGPAPGEWVEKKAKEEPVESK